MNKNKYSNIGKKQIINVVSQVIQKVEAIEMTLNIAIKFMDKDKQFDEFMKKELGGNDEFRPNETDNGKGDNSSNNENS